MTKESAPACKRSQARPSLSRSALLWAPEGGGSSLCGCSIHHSALVSANYHLPLWRDSPLAERPLLFTLAGPSLYLSVKAESLKGIQTASATQPTTLQSVAPHILQAYSTARSYSLSFQTTSDQGM